MNYLIYIEHAAENLQFFLWFRDYTKRFSALPVNERNLAPVWTIAQAEAEALAAQTSNVGTKKLISPATAAVFRGTDFAHPDASVDYKGNPFGTPPRTPQGTPLDGRESYVQSDYGYVQSDYGWSDTASSVQTPDETFQKRAAGAFTKADMKWQPCKFLDCLTINLE